MLKALIGTATAARTIGTLYLLDSPNSLRDSPRVVITTFYYFVEEWAEHREGISQLEFRSGVENNMELFRHLRWCVDA